LKGVKYIVGISGKREEEDAWAQEIGSDGRKQTVSRGDEWFLLFQNFLKKV
jgi:hypothetical protein